MEFLFSQSIVVFVVIAVLLMSAVKILPEWERAVILRLGRSIGIKGPGLILVIPFVDRVVKVDTRTITMEVPPQDVVTLDNVSLKLSAVIYFRVVSPEEAIIKIEDFYFATSQLAQTTLRSILGQYQIDDLLANRDKVNHALQTILDKTTGAWGVKITQVELKQIDFPKEMQRAMARQAEAERERRAKVISADGELQRAEKLKEASQILAGSPSALQLAYLQAMVEIAGEGTHTIILPLPIELTKPFIDAAANYGSKA
jgi:regulator of protease activity HflC (stomatin/prohibitin superfamily)